MEWVIDKLQWLWEHPEVTWSGAGLTILAVLYFLVSKLFAPFFRKEPTPAVSSTFTNSGSGEQNIAQGDRSIGKQINLTAEKISSPQQEAKGDHNVFSQTGDVCYEEHHHHYPRTPQGIPLQRPNQAEHLVGREDKVKEVLSLIGPGKVVTLCGPGGIGKTALASRIAWDLCPEGNPPADFPDGLIFYSFYGRKDVSLAYDHLVRSYEDESKDSGPEAARRLLVNKQALIILDGAEDADDLPAMLRCCGGCGVLITSRKRSDAPGALVEVKRLDDLPAAEALRLYSRNDADDTTVQAICEQLGGWPLALRIAGHYLRTTGESAETYLRWLEKEPLKELGDGRHQEDNAALLLRRSVEQLGEKTEFALNIIGVLAFAPFTERPIVAILKNVNFTNLWGFCRLVKTRIVHRDNWLLYYTEDDVRFCRKILNELVNFGLLERRGEQWQVSHALVYTYARTRMPLDSKEINELAAYYIDFCRKQSAAGVPGYAHLDQERAHCLQLMETCLEHELWKKVKGLVWAMQVYLDRQGWWTENLAAHEMWLDAARKAENRKDEGVCLGDLGYIYWRSGENEQALTYYEQSLTIKRELDDMKGQAPTLDGTAIIYRIQGKYEPALELYEQSLSIRREVGDREGEGITLNNIGLLYRVQGKYDEALSYYKQCMPLRQEVGDKIGEGTTLNNIAAIYRAQGDLIKTVECLKQALAICRELGDRVTEARSCRNIGLTYEDMGDLAQAEEHIRLAVEIAEAMGHPSLEKWRKTLERLRVERRGV